MVTVLEFCPTEVWQKIFTLACLDSGQTGRSLSLVSRYFHAISEPTKLQSISIEGTDHIVAFAAILDNTPAHLRHVRHFFVSTRDRDEDEEPLRAMQQGVIDAMENHGAHSEEWIKSRQQLAQAMASRRSRQEKREKAIFISLQRILRNIASKVETMSLFLPSGEDTNHIFSTTFPLLEELTVYGRFPRIHDHAAAVTLPNLRCLHLHLIDWAMHMTVLPIFIANFTPSVSHLRVSGMSGMPKDLRKLPTSIKRFIFEPASPTLGWLRDGKPGHLISCEDKRITLLQEECAGPDIFSLASMAENNWETRMNGGNGSWIEADVLLSGPSTNKRTAGCGDAIHRKYAALGTLLRFDTPGP